MTLEQRIDAFVSLGQHIRSADPKTLLKLSEKARNENPWFTYNNIIMAINGIAKFLDHERLLLWTSRYDLGHASPKCIGVVAAGNIPLVGFHDLLCILIAGHMAAFKPSSKDSTLMTYVIDQLMRLEPKLKDRISVVNHLKDVDAVIATGSTNTSRHFEYYFARYPHIIRKSRTSCAILAGNETHDELEALGGDVFSYFGLGCRNVSKIFVPRGFDMQLMAEPWNSHRDIIHHHKYANNYDYQKAIMLVNKQRHLDFGYLLLAESTKLVSPIGVLYYGYYDDFESLRQVMDYNAEQLQCIVGRTKLSTVGFGQAQYPDAWDYADGVDTLEFLTGLN